MVSNLYKRGGAFGQQGRYSRFAAQSVVGNLWVVVYGISGALRWHQMLQTLCRQA